MELKFRYSNIAVFRIVEYNNKKFILDSTSIKGKSYFLGWLPKKVIANMVELSPSNNSFEIKSKTRLGTSTVAIMVQPLVGISYRFMKQVFINWGVSQQIILKLGIFAFSMLLSYLMAVWYGKRAKLTFDSRIPKESKSYCLVFEPKGKRMFDWYITIIANIVCLSFFIGTNNGTEGALLIVNGIISWFGFVFMRMPQIPEYYKTLVLNEIKEL
ncbi:hypothetical protein BTU61_07130 [Streptococcus lactarius]|uniref:DUF443 family protein n=1 Tax=Streptococcus lactarius TaxID=684066 RepID=A0A9X0WQ62_9STRE|nr:DUF443 family protein [Streptococcus lactarius]MBK4779963.1 hypothetical protein [Streptococcus lactarius]QUB39182.1 DUF443 family protein [Streptococcus lactarius]